MSSPSEIRAPLPSGNAALSPSAGKAAEKPAVDRMSPEERRAGVSLAAIFSLRMLGIFLVLPVFAIYAQTLPSGADLSLVGLALGAYGATQIFFQIPFGIASDRFGRKPVIIFGLLLFAAGSVLAATAADLPQIIAGRILQGAGAISAAVTALASDLTREQHRTKAMAMIGASIGLTFAVSMVAAPLLYAAIGMPGIFLLTGALALAAIALLLFVVPAAPPPLVTGRAPFARVLRDGQLLRLNFGVFALHLMQTAMWVLVPSALVHAAGLPAAAHWKVYLPAVLASFAAMIPAIIIAERHGKIRPVFTLAIALLVIVQIGFWLNADSVGGIGFWLFAFFVAFNVLEAMQPSLISRIAPPEAKGAALGVYNATQSLGLFLGGVLGGTLAKYGGSGAVWGFCAAIGIIWLLLGASLKVPPARNTTHTH